MDQPDLARLAPVRLASPPADMHAVPGAAEVRPPPIRARVCPAMMSNHDVIVETDWRAEHLDDPAIRVLATLPMVTG